MLIESIQTYNFRNLTPSLVDTNHQHITLTGDNGQGKSNLLEAVYIICYGSSFRSRSHKQLIRFNEKEMSLIAQIRTQDRHHTVKLTIQDGKRRIYIDDTEISDRKALFSICTSIIFSHEDMDFVQGAPAEQRRFFDQTNSLINERYIDDLRMMNMIVKQRNAVLRQKDHSILAIYDQKLAEVGIQIQQQREETVRSFNELFPALFETVSADGIHPEIKYVPSWKQASCVEDAIRILQNSHERDAKYEMTTTGPHRDKYQFIEHTRDFIETASTGQRRLAALVLKSTQALLYEQATGNKPVLLLDDVLLELDIKKRERFLSSLASYDQAFFTFLPDESYFKKDSYDSIAYHVERGSYSTHEESC